MRINYPRHLDTKNQENFNKYILSLPLIESSVLLNSKRFRHSIRNAIASKYLIGYGLEIGPGDKPLAVGKTSPKPKYMDYASKETLSRLYGVSKDYINCDIVGSIEKIPCEAKSFDWVASSHVLEHSIDPIKSVKECLRVLKDNGVLYITVPNAKTSPFDYKRATVSIKELIHVNHMQSNELRLWSKGRYEDFIKNTRVTPKEDYKLFENIVKQFIECDRRIHFYPYGPRLLVDVINTAADQLQSSLAFIDGYYYHFSNEITIICKKLPKSQSTLLQHSQILEKAKPSREILFKAMLKKQYAINLEEFYDLLLNI